FPEGLGRVGHPGLYMAAGLARQALKGGARRTIFLGRPFGRKLDEMNARTFLLMAAMTALFLAIGYAIGGEGGMVIALGIAGAMNLFAYWNADKMVLSMHGAQEIDRATLPWFYDLIARLAQRAGLPMPKV